MYTCLSSLSKSTVLLSLVLISFNSYSQQDDGMASESTLKAKPSSKSSERISNADLIKLATKAPARKTFSTEEQYNEAKRDWIEEYPDAYDRIQGEKLSSAPSDTVGRQNGLLREERMFKERVIPSEKNE